VDVTYTFKAGCITVLARDAESSERQASTVLAVLDRGPSTVTMAVFRQESWSHTLEITTAARERSCEGPVVAQQVHTVELRKPRIEPLAVTLTAEDLDGDTYIPISGGGTDCDDTKGAVHPGVREVCDDRDNDCDGLSDEEGGSSWYPDQDGDGFGDRQATPRVSCTKPSGPPSYVADNADCRDSDAATFPRIGVFEELCNDVDDDCDGVVDDGFAAKGSDCAQPCPGGSYVCNATYTGLTCGNTPPLVSIFPDEDGDGAGREGASSSGSICPGAPPPAGASLNTVDCDDQDPHNRRGSTESCDARDNTCNTQVDEGDVCAGKGWKLLNDPALTGSRHWKTVALGAGGLPVWVAGNGGKLAVRRAAGQAFTTLDGDCGSYNWISAWVRPSDGTVFLGSDGGRVVRHNGTNCAGDDVPDPAQPITGLVGFPTGTSTKLYLTLSLGRLVTWTPGSSPLNQYNLFPETYAGLHGLTSSLLLGVGGSEGDPSVPSINSHPGTGTTVLRHTLQGVPSGYNGSLRAVWMGSSTLAYAVGDGGLVMKWDGDRTWTRVLAPSHNPGANFTSVMVLDGSSIYTTDLTGAIRRLSASGWVHQPLYDAAQPLRDIAASSPGDIWAVGDSGTVVHFPE
jgi:hypothetical protein